MSSSGGFGFRVSGSGSADYKPVTKDPGRRTRNQKPETRNQAAAARLTRGDLLILAAALAMRLLYLLSAHHAYFFDHLQTEALRYHEWATLILDAPVSPRPPFEQSPGYAYVVAALYALFGRSVTVIALFQAGIDALTCTLIAFAGRQIFGTRAGNIAGWLAALYGPFIYFSAQLLPVTLFVFLCVAALCAALRPNWLLAGGLWAAALAVRSEVVLAFPLIGLDAWRRGRWPGLTRTLAPLVACLVAFIALNAAFSPNIVLLTTSGGENLWLGNNPHADGVSPFVSGPLTAIADGMRTRTHNDAVAVDREFRQLALAFWRTAPADATRLLRKKFLWMWTDRELPNTSDIDWETAHSWLFRPPFFPVSFGMILPFAIAGALLLGRHSRERHWRELELLGALLLIGVGTCVVFFTNARFRLIMVPSLLLLAGHALDRLPAIARDARHQAPALALVASGLALGLIAAWNNFDGVRAYRIPQLSVNSGILEREAGHFAEAIGHLHDGLAGDPQDDIAWVHLALALEQHGEADAALQAYRDGLAAVPESADLRTMAERFCERQGLDPTVLTAQ